MSDSKILVCELQVCELKAKQYASCELQVLQFLSCKLRLGLFVSYQVHKLDKIKAIR